jgi:hypothetical protein
MTDKQVIDALGEMEIYFVQCYASASVGGRAEKRFGRYIAALKQAKDIVKKRGTAENKEDGDHDK